MGMPEMGILYSVIKTSVSNVVCFDLFYVLFDIEQLISISTSTGIILEPTYSMKTVKGILTELQSNPARFKGKRILYMFTGVCP